MLDVLAYLLHAEEQNVKSAQPLTYESLRTSDALIRRGLIVVEPDNGQGYRTVHLTEKGREEAKRVKTRV